MAFYDYSIALGADAAALTNVEDIISHAPVGKPIPLGSVRQITLNQHVQTNGIKIVTWSWSAMSWADFYTLITYIFGDFDTENATVTINTRTRAEGFERVNANAILPVESEDYQRRAG